LYLCSKYFSIQDGLYFALAHKVTLAFSISIIVLKLANLIKDRFFNKKDKDDNATNDPSSRVSSSTSSGGRGVEERMGATVNSYNDPSLKPPAERRIWDID
ncbi:MAG: hypothetical protein KR126chlam6_01465, partial [Candidatus Anoxychlamydiales bacterium]|nr:hypothetical protein [Candidatus Anoxychlamydiales bacterium]